MFKEEVELRSPESVLEIDTETVDDKVHFRRFFACSRQLLMVLEMDAGHISV